MSCGVAEDCRILCAVDGRCLLILVRWRRHCGAIGRWRHRGLTVGEPGERPDGASFDQCGKHF